MPKTWHYPIQTVNTSDEFEADLDDVFKLESGNEYRWLDKVAKKSASIQTVADVANISWTAFHIADGPQSHGTTSRHETINSILPSINHKVNTVDYQHHVMSMNVKFTKFLNPSQTTVSCSDQPLYAIKKVIQWSFPHLFADGDFLAFLGPMYIEQALFSSHG